MVRVMCLQGARRVSAALRERTVVYLSEIDHAGLDRGVGSTSWIGALEEFDADAPAPRSLPPAMRTVMTTRSWDDQRRCVWNRRRLHPPRLRDIFASSTGCTFTPMRALTGRMRWRDVLKRLDAPRKIRRWRPGCIDHRRFRARTGVHGVESTACKPSTSLIGTGSLTSTEMRIPVVVWS